MTIHEEFAKAYDDETLLAVWDSDELYTFSRGFRAAEAKYRHVLEHIANAAVMSMGEDRKIKGDLVGKCFFIETLARDALEQTNENHFSRECPECHQWIDINEPHNCPPEAS